MGSPTQGREGGQPARPRPIIDPSIALELSASLANEHRLGFARSFSAEIVAACWQATDSRPAFDFSACSKPKGIDISRSAVEKARHVAEGIASLPAAEMTYAVGALYTALLPEPFKARHGIFYTPPGLVEHLLKMVDEAGVDWRAARVLDPACGGGAFLVGVAGRIVRALAGAEPAIILRSIGTRLRGFDVDPFGGWLAQAMLGITLRRLVGECGLAVPVVVDLRDSLELRKDDAEQFDLVIGNPPYGRVTLSPMRRRQFAGSVYGHANLYGVFTDAALRWVKRGGVVGYVTPTSMLSGLYYNSLRTLLAAEAPPLSVNFVSERDGVFSGVLQETMLATYRKSGLPVPAKVGFVAVAKSSEVLVRKAGSFSLPKASRSPWLLPRAPDQASLVRRLRSMPYRLSDYGYRVSTGPLVWNRHKDQLQANETAGAVPVIWAEAVTSDGRFIWRSQKRNHAPWFSPRLPKDNWLIVTEPCVLLQRTTAKEQSKRLIAAELPETFIRGHGGVTIENHLNMVRPVGQKPLIPAVVLSALFNSPAVDAAFRCINGSVAVSAFELEELPLPSPLVMGQLVRLTANGAPPAQLEAVIAGAYRKSNAPATA